MLSIGTIEYDVFSATTPSAFPTTHPWLLPKQFYWKLKGNYPANGPYPTEDAAKAAAVEHFEEIKRKVLSGGKSTP